LFGVSYIIFVFYGLMIFLFILVDHNEFVIMNKLRFSKLRTWSKKVKCPQLSSRFSWGKIKFFGYYVIPNNILDKILCNLYPYIINECVVLFPIIFWISTLYMFFYPYIKVSNNKLLFLIIFWILTSFKFFILILKVNNIFLPKINF